MRLSSASRDGISRPSLANRGARALQARVLDPVRELGAEGDPADLRRALVRLEPVQEILHAEEQARVMRLLGEGVIGDRAAGTAVVVFRTTGIQGLAKKLAL